MKRFIFLFSAIFISALATEITCTEQVPRWMQEQISQQLGSNSIAIKDIQDSFERINKGFYGEFAPIALVQFEDGSCKWKAPTKCKKVHLNKAKAFASSIEALHSSQPLPEFSLLLSLDACFERPYHLHLSSVPVFSVSKSERNKRVLLFPRGAFEPGHSKKIQQIIVSRKPLSERKEKLLWRLKTFDRPDIEYNWRLSPLTPLLFLGKKNKDHLEFGIPKSCQRFVASKVSGHLRDMYKPDLSVEETLNYRYQLAFDYRSSPLDLEEQLFSGAVIFRAKTRFSEWFTSLLEPHKHYIPIDERCDQIFETMDWCRHNEKEANQIAENAQNFADCHLNKQQMFTYLHYLLCSYAKKLGESHD